MCTGPDVLSESVHYDYIILNVMNPTLQEQSSERRVLHSRVHVSAPSIEAGFIHLSRASTGDHASRPSIDVSSRLHNAIQWINFYKMPDIQVTPTPNPNSLKFTLEEGVFIGSGMESFNSPVEAESHPLGSRLFSLPGVINIFILPQFLTVTKHPAEDWDTLIPKIETAIKGYLESAQID